MSFIEDLQFARTAERAVEITTYTGEQFLAGVHSFDENTVSFYAPRHFGDDTTRRRVELANLASVTVTDMEWKIGS